MTQPRKRLSTQKEAAIVARFVEGLLILVRMARELGVALSTLVRALLASAVDLALDERSPKQVAEMFRKQADDLDEPR